MSTPVAQAAATAAKNAGFMARLEQGPLRKYLGVEGGVLLRGGPFTSLNASSPTFRKFNNALTLAPLWKWGLAIVPLMGVFTGTPSVENLDVNTSIALASTGAIWAYYSTLVRPKSDHRQTHTHAHTQREHRAGGREDRRKKRQLCSCSAYARLVQFLGCAHFTCLLAYSDRLGCAVHVVLQGRVFGCRVHCTAGRQRLQRVATIRVSILHTYHRHDTAQALCKHDPSQLDRASELIATVSIHLRDCCLCVVQLRAEEEDRPPPIADCLSFLFLFLDHEHSRRLSRASVGRSSGQQSAGSITQRPYQNRKRGLYSVCWRGCCCELRLLTLGPRLGGAEARLKTVCVLIVHCASPVASDCCK